MTEEKNKGGRPPVVLSPEQVAQVEALSAYLSVEQIADYLGIAHNTFTDIRERQPAVFEAYKRGRAKAIAVIAQKGIIQQAQEGNVAAACFYLKTQAGWREKQEIEHTAPSSAEYIARLQRAVYGGGDDVI